MVSRSGSPEPEVGWLSMEDLISAFQASVRRAEERMVEEKGDLQYVLTELNVTFPAQVHVDENQRTVMRMPSPAEPAVTREREALLSKVTFSFRPVPTLREEPAPSQPAKAGSGGASPAADRPAEPPAKDLSPPKR